ILGEDIARIMWKNAELEKDKFIFESEIAYAGDEKIQEAVRLLLLDLHEEILKEKLGYATMNLKDMESGGKPEEVEKYLKLCQTISEELTKIKQEKQK
ncbi:MAG: hypothetical protein AAB965_01365, partial [Patescibacteria group bacterium]